jgi:hypothetical protein
VLDLLAREERTVLLVTHSPAVLDLRWRQVDLAGSGRTAGLQV